MIEKLQQYDITIEGFVILNNSYSLPKGNRLHQQAHKVLSTPSYVTISGGPYEQQSDLSTSSNVRNFQGNAYSSNITATQHRVQQCQRSSILFNRQHSQRVSTDNNDSRKRPFSPHIAESNDSINNSEITNEVSSPTKRQNTSSKYTLNNINIVSRSN